MLIDFSIVQLNTLLLYSVKPLYFKQSTEQEIQVHVLPCTTGIYQEQIFFAFLPRTIVYEFKAVIKRIMDCLLQKLVVIGCT